MNEQQKNGCTFSECIYFANFQCGNKRRTQQKLVAYFMVLMCVCMCWIVPREKPTQPICSNYTFEINCVLFKAQISIPCRISFSLILYIFIQRAAINDFFWNNVKYHLNEIQIFCISFTIETVFFRCLISCVCYSKRVLRNFDFQWIRDIWYTKFKLQDAVAGCLGWW